MFITNSNSYKFLTSLGVMGIIGFFLPFFSVNALFAEINISGYNIIKAIFNLLKFGESVSGLNSLIPIGSFSSSIGSNEGFTIIVILFVLYGPIYFALKSAILTYYASKEIQYQWSNKFPIFYYLVCFILPLFVIEQGGYFQFIFKFIDISFIIYLVIIVGVNRTYNKMNSARDKSEIHTSNVFVKSKSAEDWFSENSKTNNQDPLTNNHEHNDTSVTEEISKYDEFNISIKISDYLREVSSLLKNSNPDLQTFVVVLREKIKKDEVLGEAFIDLSDADYEKHIKQILLKCNRKKRSDRVLIIANYYKNNMEQKT